jgi:amidase
VRHGLQLGPGVHERFAWSATISAQQVEQHGEVHGRFRADFTALLGSNKILVLPTMPDIAPLLTEPETALEDYRNQAIRLLCLAGLSGCPQISLPLMTLNGAPLGFSIIGPHGSDQALIRLAARLLALDGH